MSGHSKWETTHRQKELIDAKRGAVFTKFANVISIAARNVGDPAANPSLRAAIDKARDANMPKDNIDRAIKKGTGELGGDQVEELYYEGIGPAGIQVIVKCVTDNKNRSAATVRHSFTKIGGAFGAVMWNFHQTGVILFDQDELAAQKLSLDDLELALIDAGAEDIKIDGNQVAIYMAVNDLQAIGDFLRTKKIRLNSAEVEYVPKETVAVAAADRDKIEKFMEDLEDNEDVNDYYTNAEL
jgi:YebC/PmpR family DNA-binding regulatory protein